MHSWVDSSKPSTVSLVCVHGLGLSAVDYDPFAKKMANLGIATYAINIRGFGPFSERSAHQKVDLPGTIGDIKIVIDTLRQRYPERKTFLLGESMGGSVALAAAASLQEDTDCGQEHVIFQEARFSHKSIDALAGWIESKHLAQTNEAALVKHPSKLTSDSSVLVVDKECLSNSGNQRLNILLKQLGVSQFTAEDKI